MTLEAIFLAAAIVAALAPWEGLPGFVAPEAPDYRPAQRAVENWRSESVFNLDIGAQQTLALTLGRDIRGVSRCVRLNNYWCVKKAGWTGEIAADAEGHVAFASAADGAAVAAQLLRRYYVDFRLRSARAIVKRWAPAQCGYVALASMARRPTGRRLLGPEPKGLTTRGLAATSRAKWLAAHGRGVLRRGHGRRPPLRRSAVADRAPVLMRTPTIVAGAGPMESPATERRKAARLGMLAFPGRALGPDPRFGAAIPALPARPCPSEAGRIASYAASLATGIGAGPDDDLKLFDADLRPTPNFARALANMAAVEIGPLRAREALVEAAVAALPARAPERPARP